MDFFSIYDIILLPNRGRMSKMVFKNYYKILDLETSHVSIDEIKTAYRLAAKKYHPDLNVGDELAEERIKDINEAYKVLSIPASKRKYARVWNSHFGKSKKAFSGKNEKGAIFNMFLGDVGKDNGGKGKQHTKNPIKGENVETEINTTIQEAFYGADKKISLRTVEGKAKNITFKRACEGALFILGYRLKNRRPASVGRLFIDIFIQIYSYRIWTRILFNVTIYTKVTTFVYVCRYLKERKSKIFVFLSALQHKGAMPD